MFKRLSRIVRSFFGFFISVAENPEIILEQNIRDMNDQVPRMNESIAMVKANVTLLEKEEAKYKYDLDTLTSKIKAAIQAGRDDLAGAFATQLEQLKARLDQLELDYKPSVFKRALISCTGIEFCNLAVTETKEVGRDFQWVLPSEHSTT